MDTHDIADTAIVGLATAIILIIIYTLYKAMDTKQSPTNPVTGRVTSGFGPRKAPLQGASTYHNGVDIAVVLSTPVKAPWDATVDKVWTDNTYGGGLSARLTHPNGYSTGYAHLSAALVSAGQTIQQGQVFARSGNSGNSTGPHLHFTLTNPKGTKIDPLSMFDFKS